MSAGHTTSQQRDAYEAAVASKAAHEIRENGEPISDAIDYAFSAVHPSDYFPPTMAAAIANAQLCAAELARVECRVHTLLTLGRAIDPAASDAVPLTRQMPNGATVADWLGTAATAASQAKFGLERVREGREGWNAVQLDVVRTYLVQALAEVDAVIAEVTR